MALGSIVDLSGPGWRLWRDTAAKWDDDVLYLPPVDLAALPVHPPTGGWTVLESAGAPIDVPGTVEQHHWAEGGDYRGVSWWTRELLVPTPAAGQRVLLRFEAVRLRAEVFLDQQLVGYDLVGGTPFEVDLTGRVRPGQRHQLAVRITDPCGNFSWEDFGADRWGAYSVPASHGFGGIIAPVRLAIVPPIYIEDVFVKNKPQPREIDLVITIRNRTGQPARQSVRVQIASAADPAHVVHEHELPAVDLPPGDHELTYSAYVPQAELWTPDTPNLYRCDVTLAGGAAHTTTFGFRWFAVEDVGQRPVFRLNGRRIVLRSSISWGFWPVNGSFPTPALAARQITTAKALGLNMLSFHRGIGQPIVLDRADELGLLYYEEPGGYASHGGDDFCCAWAREKLLRMVQRDRNHPALVIYNMINEEGRDPTPQQRGDMRDAHRLDPTRCITFTSGWNKDGEDAKKLHMLPYDERQYVVGWTDFHHATGPGVYRDEFYKSPSEYRLHTTNASEIVVWGEEGAIGTPPRLELIVKELAGGPDGWDGADYHEWYQAYADYLDRKHLRPHFPTVDALTETLGDISHYYQGRMIENVRLGDLTDAYVVNGWECEKLENHSGIVDVFRHAKGRPAILAHYNQPLYVAVKLHTKVAHAPARVFADFFIINERDLHGEHTLTVSLEDAGGRQLWLQDYPVKLTGGEQYGELLAAGVEIAAECGAGQYAVRAVLRDAHRAACATGFDELFLVDWRSMPIPPGGALLDDGTALATFLKDEKHTELPAYAPALGPLHYVVAGDWTPQPRARIPAACFVAPTGTPGLAAQYFRGTSFNEPLMSRADAEPFITPKGAEGGVFVPDAGGGKHELSVRWTGKLRAPESGAFTFHADADDGLRVWLDHDLVLDDWREYAWWHHTRPVQVRGRTVTLEAGHEYDVQIEFWQNTAEARLSLYWVTPSAAAAADAVLQDLLRRVHDDGTTLVVLRHALDWAEQLAAAGVCKLDGWMHGKRHWLGSNFFAVAHPLLADLPVNCGMNWQYQEFAEYFAERYGLLLEYEEVAVGFVGDHMHQVGTAVGVLQRGRGRIVLSTLDILPRLNEPRPPCEVVRKVLCNYLAYAAAPSG